MVTLRIKRVNETKIKDYVISDAFFAIPFEESISFQRFRSFHLPVYERYPKLEFHTYQHVSVLPNSQIKTFAAPPSWGITLTPVTECSIIVLNKIHNSTLFFAVISFKITAFYTPCRRYAILSTSSAQC